MHRVSLQSFELSGDGESATVHPSLGIEYPVRTPPAVSIVCAGRNNAKYLSEALDSALTQTIPCEVVYSDDFSTDDSLQVAISFLDRGLRVLRSETHQGVCAARNRGARATSAPYLIHLDSDDRLPPDFAEQHLRAMESGVPFAYGPARAFGNKTTFWPVLPWDKYDLWRHNTVNTSAIYTRWAFDAAGGWQESADVPTMWDFDLAIRAQRYGTPRMSNAVLYYRQHDAGFSHSIGETEEANRVPYAESIRRKNARICIGSIVSGRLPGIFSAWLDAVRSAALFAHLHTPPKLLLLFHDGALNQLDQYLESLKGCDGVFSAVEIQSFRREVPQIPEMAHRDGVAALLAEASARLQATCASDLMWLVEDDILVPRSSLRELFAAITAGSVPPLGISGVYKNRHPQAQEKCLGGWIKNGKREEPVHFSPVLQPVDFVGTGCLLFWTNRPGTPKVWNSYCSIEAQPAHDFAWSERAGEQLFIHGGIRCGHARSETEFITL
jgi:glycosyltransferase involved in cell wall biosynthesis